MGTVKTKKGLVTGMISFPGNITFRVTEPIDPRSGVWKIDILANDGKEAALVGTATDCGDLTLSVQVRKTRRRM